MNLKIFAPILFIATSTAIIHADDSPVLTYSKDIAPIFQKHCQSCHHVGTAAPMSLMTYEEIRPWTKSIRKVVSNRQMPPWHADAQYGHFKNDRRLSGLESSSILNWIEQGSPAGDPKDHPPQLVFAEGWLLGEPDHILPLPEHELSADTTDQFITFNVATDFSEDKWIQAVEFRPGNPSVVHHIVTSALGTFAPGRQPSSFDEGTGMLIAPHEKIMVQMHYHKDKGAPAKDQSQIGLHFARGPIHKQIHFEGAFNFTFKIAPNEENVPVLAEYNFQRDSHLLALKPHMHLRGRDMTYTATYPDGREEILLAVPNYDYNWQTNYELAESKPMPKGTVIKVLAHFDNSSKNPNNPDPSQTVKTGENTTDEMMIGWVTYTDDEEDIAAGKTVATRRWGGRNKRNGSESMANSADAKP